METLFCRNRDEWRAWLEQNHNQCSEIWLIYFKKHTKKETVSYNDAVEEALCFGWIDSLVKSIDSESYMQKYTPRKANSVWSLANKKRVEKLIKEGKMTHYGMVQVEMAKKNGQWDKAYSSKTEFEIPEELMSALKEDSVAFNNFFNFPPSSQNNYVGWILSAKKKDTVKKRIEFVVDRSKKNLKPGMM